MKPCSGLLLVLLSFLMLGCPLRSDYPLGDSRNAPMNERYIGKWIVADAGQGGKEFLSIFPFNENEYYVETNIVTEGKLSRFRAYSTVIDNVDMLNAQEIDDRSTARDFSFFKISLSADNTLTLWFLDDGPLSKKPSSREDLLGYVRKNIGN
jgi:hypothetical protein